MIIEDLIELLNEGVVITFRDAAGNPVETYRRDAKEYKDTYLMESRFMTSEAVLTLVTLGTSLIVATKYYTFDLDYSHINEELVKTFLDDES